ncbi:Retroelement pol polyprotein, partial [Globisporangium splendens]
MLGGTLRQGAAQWFIVKKTEIEMVDQFFLELGNEFVPADLQERLRDQLGELSQGQCRGLDDYVSRFGHVITQVQEMSELDKIIYFVRGLGSAIRTEVRYRRCSTLSEAITLALDYDRSHRRSANGRRSHSEPRYRRFDNRQYRLNGAGPTEVDNVRVLGQCRAPRQQRQASTPQAMRNSRDQRPAHQARRSNSMVEHNLATVDEVDYPIVFDNAELNAVEVARKINLFVVNGRIDGNDVHILIDSGASTNLIQRFDGRRTKKQANEVEASCQVQDKKFEAMQFTEWDLPKSHDVIFDQSWFVEHNPIIDWRKQTFQLPEDASLRECSGSKICAKIKNAEYEELFVVKVSAVDGNTPVVPLELKPVIDRFADCFPEKLPDGLPPERAVNFELQAKPDAVPSSRTPFRLSKAEQDALGEFVRGNVKKRWIEVSNSPWISNIFGVPKKDPATGMAVKRAERLCSGNSKVPIRWVIDYRYVSSQTKIPKIPLPHIEELFDQMLGATVFTVIDLAQGYHQMRVKPDSRPYTAFRLQKETYQRCVAPMGLAGIPEVWSHLMRVLFGKLKFVVVYLDDICIFSRSMSDHAQHLAMVCEVLRHEKLYARLSKCEFGKFSVQFLGHTVAVEGIQVDAHKTTAIEKYPTPTTQKTLLCFLDLAGYYRRFIYDFARIALLLHRLIKKDAKWTWSSEHGRAFHASGYCMGGVLSRKVDGLDAPIAFYSKKFGYYKEKWPAHEKELLAIEIALSKWRHYLHGCSANVVADALSRPGLEEVKPSDELPKVSTPEVHACDDACHARSQSISRHVLSREVNSKFVKRNGLLFLRTKHPVLRLCVPNSSKLVTDAVQEFHGAPVAAHPGARRTQLKAAQWYYWPTLEKDIHEYVGSCQTCARWKSNNRKKIGLMMPITTPQECWDVVSMDFITGLPVSEGFGATFVTVDKLSKRPKYHPTHSTADAEGTAKVFFEAVLRHHGQPKVAISNRDPKFTSGFWKSLEKLIDIKLSMTTSHRAPVGTRFVKAIVRTCVRLGPSAGRRRKKRTGDERVQCHASHFSCILHMTLLKPQRQSQIENNKVS